MRRREAGGREREARERRTLKLVAEKEREIGV